MPAAVVAGGCMMLGGAAISHVSAGHLTNLSAMAWMPALFWVMDRGLHCIQLETDCADVRKLIRTVVLGAVIVAMQILAGHPQYVYITGLALGIYGLFQALICRVLVRWILLVGTMYGVGACLAAVQLIPGIVATAETVRSRALDYGFASMFAFPIENLATFVVPDVYGGMHGVPYFGRWYMWEVSAFMGAGALLMATQAWRQHGEGKSHSFSLFATAAICLWIALGEATPLYEVLYDWVPGFDRFRGVSKFLLPVSLVVAAWAAEGLDHWQRWDLRSLSVVLLACGFGILLGAALAQAYGAHWLIPMWVNSGQSYVLQKFLSHGGAPNDAGLLQMVGQQLAAALVRAAAWLLALAVVCFLGFRVQRLRKYIPMVVVALAAGQLLAFATSQVDSMPYGDPSQPWRDLIGETVDEARIHNPLNSNSAMLYEAFDVAGNDPGITTRYAELMAHLAEKPASKATQYVELPQPNPLYSLLRLRHVVRSDPDGQPVRIDVLNPPLPRFKLIGRYQVQVHRESVLQAMTSPGFDPHKEVVLERTPEPVPQAEPRGRVDVVMCNTDACTLQVETDRAALLLMTDAWTRSWHVESVGIAGPQKKYELIPGDWAFRVVALQAGKHRFTIAYDRSPLHWGAAISLFMLMLCMLLFVWSLTVRRVRWQLR